MLYPPLYHVKKMSYPPLRQVEKKSYPPGNAQSVPQVYIAASLMNFMETLWD